MAPAEPSCRWFDVPPTLAPGREPESGGVSKKKKPLTNQGLLGIWWDEDYHTINGKPHK